VKKAISVLLTLLLITGTLAGCGKKNAAETTAATAAQTTAKRTTTTAKEITTSAPVLTDEQILALLAKDFRQYISHMNVDGLSEDGAVQKRANLTARQFLKYIKNKQVADIVYFIKTYDFLSEEPVDIKAYSFFNNVDVDSYKISEGYNSSTGDRTDFKVILHISKSSSALFPVGTSRWILSVRTDSGYNTLIQQFRNANDSSAGLTGDAATFCYNVSVTLGCFETMDNFNKLVANAQAKNSFNWFCDAFVSMLLSNRDGYTNESAYPVKRTELEALAKTTFGITKINFREYNLYNSTDDTIGSTGHGEIYIPAALSSSTYDQTTRIRTVIIDYYSDNAYLFKAKTMKYILRVNADVSLTLLSTRLVYDSGFDAYPMSFD